MRQWWSKFEVVLTAAQAKMKQRSAPGNWEGIPDAVFLWCDPNDPQWLERRARLSTNGHSSRAGVSMDELRYSLRAFEKFAQGFGKTFLVVDHQLPKWLCDNAPVEIIEVEDLLSPAGCYPCFNSQAIESFLHKIPALADRFVYFNDDFFLRRSVRGFQYFCVNGLPKFRLGRGLAPKPPAPQGELGDRRAHRNSSALLDQHFRSQKRLTVCHRPYPQHRSLWEWAEAEFAEAFESTRQETFRGEGMFALHSFLLPHAGAETGRACLIPPSVFEKDMFTWGDNETQNAQTAKRILNFDADCMCIQEDRTTPPTSAAVEQFQALMNRLYPNPSAFEVS